jgi:osmotically-inducible protein OsmY
LLDAGMSKDLPTGPCNTNVTAPSRQPKLENSVDNLKYSDSQLQQAVLTELSWEPSVSSAHIGVMAKAGVVTLTGHVQNFAEKHAAERAASRVKGVKAIAEEIEVRLPIDVVRGDEEIAAAALDRLAWDVSIPDDLIKVKVQKGWITLTGEVDWHYQKEAAADDVRRLLGVVGLSDQTTVRPSLNESNIRDSIILALSRSWSDPADIVVSTDGSTVRLSGSVHSLHDRNLAVATAWAARGTTHVENHIAVV